MAAPLTLGYDARVSASMLTPFVRRFEAFTGLTPGAYPRAHKPAQDGDGRVSVLHELAAG